ncbi:unnamed protein product, partial [Prorocentrum cordatum]
VALVLVVADAAVLGIRAVVVGGPPVLQKVWWPPGAGIPGLPPTRGRGARRLPGSRAPGRGEGAGGAKVSGRRRPGPVLGLRGAVPRALLKPRAPRRAGASAEERREGGGGGGGGSG